MATHYCHHGGCITCGRRKRPQNKVVLTRGMQPQPPHIRQRQLGGQRVGVLSRQAIASTVEANIFPPLEQAPTRRPVKGVNGYNAARRQNYNSTK